MSECAFCKKEVIEYQSFLETDNEYVLANKVPILPGHSLVIPKRHVQNIHELNDEEIKSLFSTVNKVSLKLKEYYQAEGLNFAWNEEFIAGQTVPHLHIHILPRKKDDMSPDPRNLYYRTEQNRNQLSSDEINSIINKLRSIF